MLSSVINQRNAELDKNWITFYTHQFGKIKGPYAIKFWRVCGTREKFPTLPKEVLIAVNPLESNLTLSYP